MSNKPTTDQMNEVIAVFMGWEFIKGDPNHKCNFCFAGDKPCTPALDRFIKDKDMRVYYEFKYHSSWDWLMPVVEKIEKEHAHVRIQVGICAITFRFMQLKRIQTEQGIPMSDIMPIAEHNDYDFIGNVFHAVYDFIQWYNQSTTTNDTTEGNKR